MTMWSMPLGKFKPPDHVNMETGMSFYTSAETYNICFETLCWMADAECMEHHSDRELYAAGTRRSLRNKVAPDRFNPSKEVANSKERGSHKPMVRDKPSRLKEGRKPNQVKAKRNK